MGTGIDIDTTFSKKIFAVCLFFFLLLQGYGIYYTELRTQFEVSSSGIWFSEGSYQAPMYRYAFILNKFLVFPCFWFHLPMRIAAMMFCINDCLFYLGVALMIILLARRYDYAAAVLASPVLIHGSYFYLVVNEIFLSGSLLIAFTAIDRYMIDSHFKKAVLFTCMFYIIWSHPIMLLVLLVFLPFIYPAISHLRQSWYMLLFIAINVVVRLLLLSHYDDEKMGQLHGQWFELSYWLHTAWDWMFEYSPLFLLMLLTFYYILKSDRKAQYIGLAITALLLAFCNSIHMTANDPNIVKYLYPITLFSLMLSILFICSRPALHRNAVLGVMAFFLFFSFKRLLQNSHPAILYRAELIKKTNLLCIKHDPRHSKWFVQKEIIDSLDGFSPSWHTESIFFSAFADQHPTIQVVRASQSEREQLLHFPAGDIYMCPELAFPITSLNPVYFHFRPEEYKELVLDSAEIKYLKE